VHKEIKEQIQTAALGKNKIAMFHFQVLKHAPQLAGADPAEFCRLVGVPESYKTEFQKMLSLVKLMEQQGAKLS